MEETFVKAVIRTALIFIAARHEDISAGAVKGWAADWEKWVWRKEEDAPDTINR